MKKSFAGGGPTGISIVPERGGPTATLTGYDLTTNVAPGQIFKQSPNFINNCKSCNNMKNAVGTSGLKKNANGYYDYYSYGGGGNNSGGGGGFLAGLNLGDLLKIGSTIYSNQQQIKLAEQQGQITSQQAAQARAQLAIAQQKTQQDLSIKDKIKAYGLPIAIGGVVIVLGIATYFYFKRSKKVAQ
jgi:hypothetical protein